MEIKMSSVFKDNEKYKEERKFIITRENIRKDITEQIRKGLDRMFSRTAVLIGLVPLFVIGCFVGIKEPLPVYIGIMLLLFLLMLPFLYLLIREGIRVFPYIVALFRRPVVVTEKLMGYDKKRQFSRIRFIRVIRWYHFRHPIGFEELPFFLFENRKKLILPETVFSWDENPRENNETFYETRKDCGTDFYLVLTKEKNGKILLAYPTKITELHF